MKFLVDNYTNTQTIIETKVNLALWQVTYLESTTGQPKQDVK